MRTTPTVALTYLGRRIDTSPQAFGELRSSGDLLEDQEELRARMSEDGYLYLPGLLERSEVLAARKEVLRRLDAAGRIDRSRPLSEGIPAADVTDGFVHSLADDNEPLEKVVFHGPMVAFCERFLGGAIRHFDYIWLRAKKPGTTDATAPHYDVVFMGRGTKKLCTAWTPLEDVPVEKGGLMILEGSHRLSEVKSTYGAMDVDTYCTNRNEAKDIETGQKQWEDRVNGGKYADDAVAVREALGGRWLTTDFRAGDVLLFGMYTMHASSDNHARSYRLSTDTRYQLASEPVDERWVGENPPAHGPAGKRGMIC
jgi:ectoine hydroxylase-related dioxygenase (phytanoyl-CoA dioxygenase family)